MDEHHGESYRALQLALEQGAFRLRDAQARGIHHETVYRLVRRGLLERVGRGLYRSPDAMVTENHALVLTAKIMPDAVICLLSALQFHELTTQLPFEVWVAIERRAARPRVGHLPVRVVRYSCTAMRLGVEEHLLEGVRVRVFSPAKTVVDCFRYRRSVGFDVALEALRDCRQQNKCTPAELWDYATKCRVGTVMRPYIEALG
jgi:predicted transcriptional regulator of viral defense system